MNIKQRIINDIAKIERQKITIKGKINFLKMLRNKKSYKSSQHLINKEIVRLILTEKYHLKDGDKLNTTEIFEIFCDILKELE